ncbi:sugar transferase [Candidatus Parcubacteria bacterium]|nr:sugar transferase [Candidatus Parcubacteria bacterium]
MHNYNEPNIKKIKIPKAKRIFDIVVSAFLLTILSPLFIIILFAIFIEHIFSNNVFAPLFYIETRISQGKPFNFIKFNIFHPEAIEAMQSHGQFIHTKVLEHSKNGLSKVGHIAQQIYLDELPQLFNVLKGNLSMVGPRPVNTVNYQKILNSGITTKAEIKAGLTGNYQSRKGEEGISQDKLDRDYINFCLNNYSFKIVLLDIKILLRTLIIIFKAEGI